MRLDPNSDLGEEVGSGVLLSRHAQISVDEACRYTKERKYRYHSTGSNSSTSYLKQPH